MNKDDTTKFIDSKWDSWYVPGLSDFVRTPNLTAMVDPDYLTNGLLQKAMALVDDYINKLEIQGLQKHIFTTEQGLPLICYVVEASSPEIKSNVMLYGHIDKQPYGEGWNTSPTDPVIKGDLMYGRGSSDDGYSSFTCMLAVKAGQMQQVLMPRICLVLETEEESGSPSLIPLLLQAKEATGVPDFLFCMDSGCIDYEQLWMTSSLRGVASVDFEVKCGKAGYHSGGVGGIVPETFRIVRQLLDRLDDVEDGTPCKELQVELPEWKEKEAEYLTQLKGMELCMKFPLVDGCKYAIHEGGLKEMYLNNVWRSNLAITGIDGIPPVGMAGNVVRPSTALRASMRLSPIMDPSKAIEVIKAKLTTDVPYNAQVTILRAACGWGWCMRDPEAWLKTAIESAGSAFFDGKPAGSYGEGGSIPFLKELEILYPQTQIIALGVGGPGSNAHAPNEMIHLPYTKKVTCALAHII